MTGHARLKGAAQWVICLLSMDLSTFFFVY